MNTVDVRIADVRATAYRVPTEQPESDGTLEWDAVTIVVVEADAGGHTGLGYTYSDAAAAALISGTLAETVRPRRAGHQRRVAGHGPRHPQSRLARRQRHRDRRPRRGAVGPQGQAAGGELADLLGRARDAVPIYGSGGLTSYPQRQLCGSASPAGWRRGSCG